MVFEKELVYTGVSKRKSQKTEKEYLLINYLDFEDGGTQFSTLAECNIPENVKPLSRVKATLELTTGRYMQLKTGNLELIK